MGVPREDILCRFIDPNKWESDVDPPRPAASVFNASNRKLSTWHQDHVVAEGSKLKDLCFCSLEGFGEALLSVEVLLQAAQDSGSPVFNPTAEWRPDEVEAAWTRWRDAHVNIESQGGNRNFPKGYRLSLAERCQVSRTPDGV